MLGRSRSFLSNERFIGAGSEAGSRLGAPGPSLCKWRDRPALPHYRVSARFHLLLFWGPSTFNDGARGQSSPDSQASSLSGSILTKLKVVDHIVAGPSHSLRAQSTVTL